MKKWAADFKRGRSTIFDDVRSGRPKTAVSEDHDIRNAVLSDQRMKVRELSNIAQISTEHVHYVLHEKLHMKKLSARWVPRLLTVDQKRVRQNVSQECWDRFK